MNYKLKYKGPEIDALLDKVNSGELGSLTSPLTVRISVGGLKVGDTYDAGTLIETILRDMLAPEVVGKCYSFVSSNRETEIPVDAIENDIPSDFLTNGISLPYVTSNIQFEYFAYPVDYGPLSSIIQNGAFEVKDAWELVGTTTKDSIVYNLYKTIDGQGDDESTYKFIPGGN